MPRPKKTLAQLESTREKILDVALSILQKSGPETVTSRAIAEGLGVAHMSLFTYFENHAAILRALRERELSKWQAQQQDFEQRATPENIVQVVEDILRHYIDFARENPNLYRLTWVMPELGIESPEENRQRTLNTVGHLAGLLQLGMESGVFENRESLLSAGTVLAMVNTPYILFHNGRLTDPAMRDRMVEEVFSATMGYLKKK
jgi:AcrR family transcriptional regulator